MCQTLMKKKEEYLIMLSGADPKSPESLNFLLPETTSLVLREFESSNERLKEI